MVIATMVHLVPTLTVQHLILMVVIASYLLKTAIMIRSVIVSGIAGPRRGLGMASVITASSEKLTSTVPNTTTTMGTVTLTIARMCGST